MIIDSRIRTLRKHCNLTQAEFGEKLGFKNAYICKLETTSRNISADLIINICITFNVSSDWLLGLTNENQWTDDEWYKPYKKRRKRNAAQKQETI